MGYSFDDEVCQCAHLRSEHNEETGVCEAILCSCIHFRFDEEKTIERDLAPMSDDWRA